MKNFLLFAFLVSCFALAQKTAPKVTPAVPAQPDVSGMYAFLHEGEFVEVDVDAERVTGFISRFGEADSDRGLFLDHMFTKGSFDGKNDSNARSRVVYLKSFPSYAQFTPPKKD